MSLRRMMRKYHIKDMLYVETFRKTQIIKFLLYAGFLIISSIIIITSILSIWKQTSTSKTNYRYNTDLKYILLWRKSKHGRKYAVGQTEFINQNCRQINCYLTYNKTLLNNDLRNFHGVVFTLQDLKKFPSKRSKFHREEQQKYIFESLETSDNNKICNPFFDNFFNWTWTYKLDSDIVHPFFNIFEIENHTMIGPNMKIEWIQNMNHVPDNFTISSKTRAVAWISQKCNNEKKVFLNTLKKELKGYNYSIDIFGSCGMKCRENKLSKCYELLDNYYFSIVIEDFIAEDFVTEKLVWALKHNTIPIVYGGADYTRYLQCSINITI